MTLLEAITQGYLLATGKSTLPATTSSKYNRLLGLAKKCYRDWQNEKGIDWDSLYSVVGAGTVSASDTFDLDTEIIKLSQREGDYVRILQTNGTTVNFQTAPASRLKQYQYQNYVSRVGTTLKFARSFTATSPEFGGTIQVPAYIKLDDLVNLSDDVLIDNPDWLPSMIAARYVLSDAQLSYMYPDLLADANELMAGMKLANGSQDDNSVADDNFFTNGLGYEC